MTREIIEDLYNNKGLTQRQIAKKLNIGQASVCRHIKKFKIVCKFNNKRNYFCQEDFFDLWSVDMAYILGFTMCDGGISVNRRHVKLCYDLNFGDREILEFIRQKICPKLPIKKRVRHRKNGKTYIFATWKLTSKKTVESLSKLGVVPRKTFNKVLPDIPVEFAADYARGIIDGDGSISIRSSLGSNSKVYPAYRVRVSCATEQFLLDLKQKCFMNLGKVSKSGKYFVWSLSRNEEVKKFLKYIYNGNFCLKRKQKIANLILNNNV